MKARLCFTADPTLTTFLAASTLLSQLVPKQQQQQQQRQKQKQQNKKIGNLIANHLSELNSGKLESKSITKILT